MSQKSDSADFRDALRIYVSPALTMYGSLATLTQSGGSSDIEGVVGPTCTVTPKKACR